MLVETPRVPFHRDSLENLGQERSVNKLDTKRPKIRVNLGFL